VAGHAPPFVPRQGYPPSLGFPPPGAPRQEDYLPRHVSPPSPGRRRLRKRNAVFLAIAGFCGVVLIATALAVSGKPAPSAATSSAPSARASSSALALAEDACAKRPPASGDIYVRTITSGASPQARTLSGKWGWDHAASKCLSAVQLVIATAPHGAGQCTQVGYAADNPGYDVSAAAAPRLTHITAQAGPACAPAAPPAAKLPKKAPPATAPTAARQVTPAAAPSTAHPTTPAAAPSTPAHKTTAAVPPAASASTSGCYPLSDDGTCYGPGDYCRAYEAGQSGVAVDGEAITCEYNHGWRWVPA
jgi:hypothetical protein